MTCNKKKSKKSLKSNCLTCNKKGLKQGRLPSCFKANKIIIIIKYLYSANILKVQKRFTVRNKMGFPYKPNVLNFTSLEERLILPRIPSMRIRELPRGGQLSSHGNIVNVPSDVNSTVHCLPRRRSESQTIPIKLKRRLGYKHHYQFQNVRSKKVLDAAKYLVDTSELFKIEGIKEQNAWINGITLQPMKSGVSLFKTLIHPVLMCKLMKLSQIVKTIFAPLMFIIQTEKKTLKDHVSCQNVIYIR